MVRPPDRSYEYSGGMLPTVLELGAGMWGYCRGASHPWGSLTARRHTSMAPLEPSWVHVNLAWLHPLDCFAAGTGAVSLALAACRAATSVTATDLADLIPHLHLNVRRNSAVLPPGRLHVQSLLWGPEGEQDIRVGALGL